MRLLFSKDEFIKPGTTLEVLSKLRPAFRKEGGSVTAGNASGLNDGAAALLLANEEGLQAQGLEPLAQVVSSAVVGVPPRIMGIGPVEASNRALAKAGLGWDDLDVIELNEAFAAQSLACIQKLEIEGRRRPHQPEWRGHRPWTPPWHDWRAHSLGCGAAIETNRRQACPCHPLHWRGAGLRRGDSQRVGIMIYSFRGMVPVVHPSAFVHPQATLIGHVTVGEDCYVGPHAVLRGDWGKIVLKRGVNVQEGCVLHMFPGTTVLLEEDAHIGHGAMVHGARIGKNCLVGMNAVVMDDVVLGEGCVVGALAMVKASTSWPDRSLIVGNPAIRKGDVSDRMLQHKSEGTALYQALPADAHAHMEEVDPLSAEPADRKEDFPVLDAWHKRKSQA